MRLLLFGCTGFIGSELVPRLSEAGHQITLVSRKKPNTFKIDKRLNSITYLQINPASPESWGNTHLINSLKDSEGIINLVGEPIAEKRWTKSHLKEMENSRINTTKYLINAISKLPKPTKVLINGSAIGFYGTSTDSVFTEKSPSGNDFLAKLCNHWESIASTKNKQIRLVIIRTGIVLEKDGGALGKMLPVFKTGFGGPIGSGLQWMSWIHRTDLCRIIENSLMNRSWTGIINAVSPNPVTMANFSNCLGKSLNRPSLLPLPGALLKVLLGDGAKVVLEGQKVTSLQLKKFGFEFLYPDLKEALQEIVKSY